MAITLKRLRCFVALAEERHFGRAAERVFLSQPALSKQTAQLEKELGIILFNRSPQGVTLTEAGRVFLPEARLALEQVGRAVGSIKKLQNTEVSRLRLGSVGPAAHSLLPNIIKTLRTAHPDLIISLNELPTTEQLELLKNDLIDLALLCADDEGDIAFSPLVREPVILGIHKESPLTRYETVPLEHLSEQTLASPHHVEPGHARLLAYLRSREVYPDVIEVDGVATAFGLISRGTAVGFFPAFVQTNPPAGVTFVSTEPAMPELETGVAWRRSDPPAILDTFLEAAKWTVTNSEGLESPRF